MSHVSSRIGSEFGTLGERLAAAWDERRASVGVLVKVAEVEALKNRGDHTT